LFNEDYVAAQYGPRIVSDMMHESGVITWMAASVGARWFTITAWEDVDQVQKVMGNNATHKDALRQFFQADFGQAVHTSVWIPHHIGGLWVRCLSCKQVSDYHRRIFRFGSKVSLEKETRNEGEQAFPE
jgi:hypothetical protein